MHDGIGDWRLCSDSYCKANSGRPKRGQDWESDEDLNRCIKDFEKCAKTSQAWYLKFSQEFLGLGAQRVLETLKAFELVPQDQVLQRWEECEVARMVAAHRDANRST